MVFLAMASVRSWVLDERRVDAPTLKRMFTQGKISASTVVRDPLAKGCQGPYTLCAKQIVENWEKYIKTARDGVTSCPGWADFIELPTFDVCSPCWCWMFCDALQGPFSLVDLRTWISKSEFPSEGMVFHKDKPGHYIRVQDVCFYVELKMVASIWFDLQLCDEAPTTSRAKGASPQKEGAAVDSHRPSQCQPQQQKSDMQDPSPESMNNNEVFDAVKFINSLPQPKACLRREVKVAESVVGPNCGSDGETRASVQKQEAGKKMDANRRLEGVDGSLAGTEMKSLSEGHKAASRAQSVSGQSKGVVEAEPLPPKSSLVDENSARDGELSLRMVVNERLASDRLEPVSLPNGVAFTESSDKLWGRMTDSGGRASPQGQRPTGKCTARMRQERHLFQLRVHHKIGN